MEDPNTNKPNGEGPATIDLSPAEASFIGELQVQIQTALRLIIRQRGLIGNWALDGDKLVKQ